MNVPKLKKKSRGISFQAKFAMDTILKANKEIFPKQLLSTIIADVKKEYLPTLKQVILSIIN